MRHLNNGTDHRHSKSCCDQSSPARRTITVVFIVCSTVGSGTDQIIIKAPRHWPLYGEFTGDRWIPRTKASNTENISIWWRHHENQSMVASTVVSNIYSGITGMPLYSPATPGELMCTHSCINKNECPGSQPQTFDPTKITCGHETYLEHWSIFVFKQLDYYLLPLWTGLYIHILMIMQLSIDRRASVNEIILPWVEHLTWRGTVASELYFFQETRLFHSPSLVAIKLLSGVWDMATICSRSCDWLIQIEAGELVTRNALWDHVTGENFQRFKGH